MTDKIFIKDLLLRAILGINGEERVNRQDVIVNVVLETDTRPAGKSDNIDDAVNYRTVAKQVAELIEGAQFFLVEKAAEEVARLCLADPRVTAVTVTVEKPMALRFARSVGVAIRRSRGDV